MHDHWLPHWVEQLPWWVKWAFMGGLGALSAFLPGVLAPNWQQIGVGVGTALIAVACLGAAWHGINDFREGHGKPRLKLEPNYLIIFGLAIALIGVAWQSYRGAAIASSTGEIAKITKPFQDQIDTLKKQQANTLLVDRPSIQPVKPPKNYFPAEKIELGNLLSQMSEHLNKEGLEVANRSIRFGKIMNTSKDSLSSGLQQLQDTMALGQIFRKQIWDDIVDKNPRFDAELKEIVGPVEITGPDNATTPFGKLTIAHNLFDRDLGILIDRYDSLSEKDIPWIAMLVGRDGESVHYAGDTFKGWI